MAKALTTDEAKTKVYELTKQLSEIKQEKTANVDFKDRINDVESEIYAIIEEQDAQNTPDTATTNSLGMGCQVITLTPSFLNLIVKTLLKNMNMLHKIADWIANQFDKLRYRGLRKSFINKVNYVPTGKSPIRVLTEDELKKEFGEKSKIITDDNRKVGEYFRRMETEVSKIRSEQKLNNQ